MHCWGGRGRAGTLGACMLGDLYGIDAEEALLRIQKAFDTRGDPGAMPRIWHQPCWWTEYIIGTSPRPAFQKCHSMQYDLQRRQVWARRLFEE